MTTLTSDRQSADMVRDLYHQLLEAWTQRNAEAMAMLFAPDGAIVGFDGTEHAGPATISAEVGRIFAHHQTPAYVGKVRSLQFLTPETVLLRAVAGMVPAGQTALKPELNAVQTMVALKQDGQWRIAHFQNTPAQYHGRPEVAQRLTDELSALLR